MRTRLARFLLRRLAMRADAMARALGGRRCGSGWVARCPAHDDRTPSLSIREKGGKILVHCHTGCPQDAVLQELRVRGLCVWMRDVLGSCDHPEGVGQDGRVVGRLMAWVDELGRSRKAFVDDPLR